MDRETKEILLELFSILGFSDEEKKSALTDFQKKLAMELLRMVQDELPEEYREFVATEGAKITDPGHPMVLKIQIELKKLHTMDEYFEMSRGILKKLLPDYIRHMSEGLSAEKIELLENCLKKI